MVQEAQVTQETELEKRLKALRKGQTLIIDPRQAKDLGYDINPLWNLKAVGQGEGAQPVYTFVTPERWELFPEGGAISPQGIRYSEEQIEQMRIGVTPVEGIEPAEIPVSPQIIPAVSDLLKRLFPERFRPEASWGYTVEELPEMVWTQLVDLSQRDPQALFNTIYNLGRTPDSESLLRVFVAGITAEEISRFFMVTEKQKYIDTIHSVYPDRGYEELQTQVKEDFGGFIDEIRTGGSTRPKQDLLRTMGFSWEEIGQVFSIQKLVLPVDGVSKLLTIDINRGTAYDHTGAWVGTYNYATQEFDPLPVESKLKDVWDAFYLGGKQLYQRSQEFVVSALPNFLFRDMGDFERGIYGDDWVDKVNAGNKQIRDEFRRVYSLSQNEWQEWIAKRPELSPRLEWSEGCVKHPEVAGDPMYWAYEFASTAPFMLAIMGTTVTVAAATGNPALGIAAGMAMAIPPQAQEAHETLLAHGATEEQAGLMSLPIGVLVSSIEVAGDLPYLKQVFPHIFKMFSKEVTEQLATRTLRNLAKKGLRTFSTIEIIEAMEEVAQQAVMNAGVRIIDENQSIFEGMGDVFVRTLIATAPLAVFGAGYASLRRARPSAIAGLTPLELEAKGFIQDPETGNWYEPTKLPSEIERQARIEGAVLPTTPEVTQLRDLGWADSRIAELDKAERDSIIRHKMTPESALEVPPVTPEVELIKQAELDIIPITEQRRIRLISPEGNFVGFLDVTGTHAEALVQLAKAAGIDVIKFQRESGYIRAFFEESGNLNLEIFGGINVQQEAAIKSLTALHRTGIQYFIDINNKEGTLIESLAIDNPQNVIPSIREVIPTTPRVGVIPTTLAEAARMAAELEAEAVPPPKARIQAPKVAPKPAPSVVSPPMPEAPMPKDAAGRIAQRIQTEPTDVGIADKIKRGWHTFQVKMVDDIYAIQKFRDEAVKGGIQLKIQDDPYIAGRLLRGVIGKANVFIEYGTLGKQIYKAVKGKSQIEYTGESLESILHVVREPQKWRDFSTYLVARRAVELHGREIETGISLEDARDTVAQIAGENTYFPKLANRLYEYQDRLLVYSNEMGLLSPELLEKLRATSQSYVPFYRVYNELAAKGLMGKKMANIAQPIKRIKGSEREIINPLESIVKNTYVLVSAAERNQVGIMMANLVDQNPELAEYFERVATPIARVARVKASELGVDVEGLTDEENEQVVDIFRPSFYVRGDEVTVLIDGKKRYFRVDPDLRDALLNLDRESMGLIGKFLSYPAKWLRAGATLSPDFMVRNPARDQMTAFVYSNYNFLPAVDFLKGLAGVIRRDSDYQLYRASGGERAMLVSMDRQYLSKSFKEVVEGHKFTDYVKHPLELFQIVSEFGEKATRLGEFKKGIKAGAVPLEAGYSSRNVSLDFAQAGTTAFSINRLAAFFNANVRGWGRMASSFKEHPARTSFKIFVGITLPSITLYLANRDDPRWKEIPQWQKDLFWIIFTEDAIYRIPKPFELGIIFGSMPERFLEWLDEKDPDMLKDTLLEILGQGAPNPMPTAILPVIEALTNYSFFMARKIVPDSRKNMPPELQYTGWTSEFSKKIGEWLNISPAKFENVVRGWTGGLGSYALDILGSILKGTGVSPDIPEPSPTLADIPVIKAFVVRNPYGSSGETVNKFYELLEEYQKGESYLKEMLSLDEQGKFETYKAAHPELLFYYDFEGDIFYSAAARYLRRVARDLSELRQKQDVIYKSKTMTPEEKRAKIDEIDILKTEVARRAMVLFLGEIPEVMEHSLSEADNRLGEVIEDVPVLSLELPDIYDMRKLNRDYTETLEAVTAEDLEGKAGIPATVFNWFEKETSEKLVGVYPNTSIYKINADPSEGTTFEQYYLQWQERQRITDPQELADHIKEYPKAYLGNLTKRQLELIRKYHRASEDEQAQMLKDIPDLRANPRLDWLRANPKDNARLALWGQAPILTLEAYTEFNRMVADLDIPNGAIPSLTLPPEKSIETHFLYEQLVAEGKSNSWEAQLLKAKDLDYCEWRGVEVPDVPIPSLELKTTHRNLYDALDLAKDIEDEDKREAAIDKIMQTDVGGGLQFRDILRRVEAIEVGTNEKPTPDKIINAWVNRGRVIDEFEAGSSEGKMWLVDNADAYRWALENDKLSDDGGLPDNDVYILENGRSNVKWNIPVLTINRMWREQDTWYNEGIPDNHAHISNDDDRLLAIKRERAAFLEGNEEYRLDRWRRRAFSAVGIEPDFLRFTPEQVETYVQYYELPARGYRQERFLLQHPEFAQAMNTIQGVDIPKAEDVPAVQYDEIYEQYQDLFDIWDAYGDNTSPDYITDSEARAKARSVLFSGTLGREFKTARYRRDAYKDLIGYEEQVDNFVQYYLIIDKGKPSGQDEWYDDDWFLMEHRQFYDTMLTLGIFKERRTFEKVPSREVWRLYGIYQFTPKGEPRYEMRVKYPELDDWLIVTGKVSTPVEKRDTEGISPYEGEASAAYQKWLEQQRQFEEYEERSDELDALLRDWRERMK